MKMESLNSATDGKRIVDSNRSNVIGKQQRPNNIATNAVNSLNGPDFALKAPHNNYIPSGNNKGVSGSFYGNNIDMELYQRDTTLNYAEKIKNRNITPDEFGKFINTYSKYTFEYPNLINYDDETQARVIASFPRKIGLIDQELPFKDINRFVKQYFGQSFNYNEILEKYRRDGILNQTQENYIREAISIGQSSLDNFGNYSMNNNSPANNFNTLIDRVNSDWSLTKDQRDLLVMAISCVKYIEPKTARKTAGTEVIYTNGQNINCNDCINKHLVEIYAADAAAVILAAAAAIGSIALIGAIAATGAEALTVLAAIGIGATYIALVEALHQFTSYTIYKYYCGQFCADHKTGIMTCDVCPDYTMFFDGANCYLGWYGSSVPGWIYADAFWYRGDVDGCADGNLDSSWGYVPFGMGGHGQPGGGINCLFGYNYDTSYVPWVGSSGFYLKPHCRGDF